MRSALVFLVTCTSWCIAATPAPQAPLPVHNSARTVQGAADNYKVQVKQPAPAARSSGGNLAPKVNPVATESETSESGGRTHGTLLATLFLMGVIAVRRYKSGRS